MALHRVTGLLIVVYLYLHLGVLSMLLVGRSAWSSSSGLVTAKSVLALEVALIGAVVFHGLNGIRVALVGSGLAVRRERGPFWTATAIGSAAVIVAALQSSSTALKVTSGPDTSPTHSSIDWPGQWESTSPDSTPTAAALP